MGAPKHCKINTITLTNTPMIGPVLLLEEYGSFLNYSYNSHARLTFSEPPVSSVTRRQEWLTGGGEHEHLWKTTTCVTTAHSNCYLSLQQPSVRPPHPIVPYCQMHYSKWNNNFNQNKSISGGEGGGRKSITVLPTCFSWGSIQKCKLIAWYLIIRRGPLTSINHHVL